MNLKATFLFFSSLICFCALNAQTPGVRWSKTMTPNTYTEAIYDVKPTKDKGLVIAGTDSVIYSFDFFPEEKSANHNGIIAKIDSTGNLVWKKFFSDWRYGASTSVEETRDGGFVLAGYNNPLTLPDTSAFVVFKLDSDANVEWQKQLGGRGADKAYDVIQTVDNGYLAVGKTASHDRDVTDNHSRPPEYPYSWNALHDIWAVKFDASGNIIWKKCYGGLENETGQAVIETPDGGFIIVGTSESTEGDLTNNKGGVDGWIIKIDANGNVLWQKNLGGTGNDYFRSIVVATDGDYVITGASESNDGDVSGNHGGLDLWTIKIDGNGNIKWSKCLGGTASDYGASITRTLNGNLLIGGTTSSANGDVAHNNGAEDMWTLLMSPDGELIWQKTTGTNRNDFGLAATASSDNDFAIAGFELSTVQGNGNLPEFDAALYSLGNSSTIKGSVYMDANSNGTKDAGEEGYDNVIINVTKDTTTYSVIPNNGNFWTDADTGTYTISAIAHNPYYMVVPSTTTSTFSSYFQTDSISFAVQPIPGAKDMVISLLPLGVARPGFQVKYLIEAQNVGTLPVLNASIKLVKDTRLSYISASIPSFHINDTIIWNIPSITPNSKVSITVILSIAAPPLVQLGDTLKSMALIPVEGGFTPSNDTSRLKQIVTGAYDPNDKTETNGGVITPEQVSSGEYLNYLIRFQNTGTDTAFTVIVRDTLSNMLDWSSLQMISSSHAYNLQIKDGNKLSWYFDNILLVDSNRNEPDSHGYIAFRIRPVSTLQVGDTVKNAAGIYFDYNLPVQTNTEKTTVFSFQVLPVKLERFTAVLKEGNYVQIDWKTSYEQNTSYFEIEKSADGTHFVPLTRVRTSNNLSGNSYSTKDVSPLPGFTYYRLKIIDKDGSYSYSDIAVVNNTTSQITASLYPNPTQGEVTLKLEGKLRGRAYVTITDFSGKRVIEKDLGNVQSDRLIIPLNGKQLNSGTYLVQFTVENETIRRYLIIQ